MSWQDFDLDSRLERDLLRRALPLVPTSSTDANQSTLDQATNTANHAASAVSTLGATPTKCIELLSIRPLLIGAAWKTLDLLLETAFALGSVLSSSSGCVTIAHKQSLARQHAARPSAIEPPTWAALCEVYSATVDLRHSLVHRRAHVNASDELIGVDEHGNPLAPFTPEEQEAFARTAQLAAELVTSNPPDARTHADLGRQLNTLSRHHSVALATVTLADVPPRWTVIVDPHQQVAGAYHLDLKLLRSRVGEVFNVDVIVQFRDRPGQELAGRLEMAPVDDAALIDPNHPPDWLT